MPYGTEAFGNVNGEEISLQFIGATEDKHWLFPFVKKRLFGSEPVTETECMIEKEGDLRLEIVGKDEAGKKAAQHGVWSLPFRIHQAADTRRPFSEVVQSMAKQERKRRRKNEGRFVYELAEKESDFFEFYYNMHKPTIKNRHGDSAISEPVDTAYEKLFKSGKLFLVKENGLAVSGGLCAINKEHRRLDARLIGVAGGEAQHRQSGAQAAVYDFLLEWACGESDIDEVDFQGGEPFLSKGTVQYKKRFATAVKWPPAAFADKRVLLSANVQSLAIKNFLLNNPVFLAKGDTIGCGFFTDEKKKPRYDLAVRSPGVQFETELNLEMVASSRQHQPAF